MDIQEARAEVLKAFDPATGCYYHKTDYQHHGFIDGMAWVGILTGAAYKVGDTTLISEGEHYLNTLRSVGPDARNYAKHQVSSNWIPSPTLTGYWYLKKPQSFAGPAGLYFAGLGKKPSCKLLLIAGWMYGITYPWFESHLNSIMLAYLISKKKPPFTMKKLYMSNPFYAAIAGIKVTMEYPSMYRYTKGHTETKDTIQQLAVCEPSSWIFRRNPYKLYIPEGEQEQYGYVPIWQVVGEYMQQSL